MKFTSSARLLRIGFVAGLVGLSGCDALLRPAVTNELTVPDPAAPRVEARLETEFELAADAHLVGSPQLIFSRYEDTFSDIARAYNLGFDELRQANPDIDPWLPGADSIIYLPTHHIVPDAPREGVVLNLASLRLFYFPEPEPEPEPSQAESATEFQSADMARVLTHPIGIGRAGWETPVGSGSIVSKARNPTWYVPASIRKEHAEMGDPLPAVVPPGPDNPLGDFAMKLSMPGYLIHGTNQPDGVGMRVSHGCVRLYPENIDALFQRVAVGESVRIVNQPVLVAWQAGRLYLEVHPPLEEDSRDLAAEARALITALMADRGQPTASIDWELVDEVLAARRGMPFPVSRFSPGPQEYLAALTIVENIAPVLAAEPTVQVSPAPSAE